MALVALKPPVIHEVFTPLPCPRDAQTTLELEGCAEKRILASDRTIDARVAAAFRLLARGERAGFVEGERAWLRYRRTSCVAESSKYAGGTFRGVADALCVASRNDAHVRDLARLLSVLRGH